VQHGTNLVAGSGNYIIDGKPIALQRARHGNKRTWDPQKKLKFYHGLNLKQQHGRKPLFLGPVSLNVIFHFQVPNKLSKLNKQQLLTQPHVFKPDIDNLIKFILDLGNGILYKDDCIFYEIYAKKIYDTKGFTEFTIRVYE